MADSNFDFVKGMFKNSEGKPFEMSRSQIQLFDIVTHRKHRYNHISSFTRFGKSDVISMAVLTRATSFAEKWIIVAPSTKKAKIIMGYVIGHIFDNDYFSQKFQVGKEESQERIRRERSKSHLTFRIESGGIGEIMILSIQETRKRDPLDAIMGWGAQNVVCDESSLIDDIKHTGILRMLGDSPDPFILEIGNPFRLNHFFRDSKNPKYNRFSVNYRQGLQEGRITQEQVDLMRGKPFFDVLYECKFPKSGQVDSQGWIPLLTPDDIAQAQSRKVQSFGQTKMGIDPAEGGDANAFVMRTDNRMWVKHQDHDPDLAKTAGRGMTFAREEGIESRNIYVDAIGDGQAVVKLMSEKVIDGKRFVVNAIKGGSSADAPKDFANLKSQYYWNLRKWIREGGALEPHEGWDELTEIKYRAIDSTGKIQIMPKHQMLGMGIPSPNVADSAAMTFSDYRKPKEGSQKSAIEARYKRQTVESARKTRGVI